jgi:hypothetical protein
MPVRRCGICREPGHTRRTCPENAMDGNRQQQQQHSVQQCRICNIPGHDHFHCPYRGFHDDSCIYCDSLDHDIFNCPIAHSLLQPQPLQPQPLQPQPLQPQPHAKKIYWDKCRVCGAEHNGSKYCACGEKQIVPVSKNEKGVHECTICLMDLRELNKVTTKCGHHFCIDCFLAHYSSNQSSAKNCPMCRDEILEPEPEPQPEPEQQSRATAQQDMILNAIRRVHRQFLDF